MPRMLGALATLGIACLGFFACGRDTAARPDPEPAFVPHRPTVGPFLPMPPLPEPRGYASVIEVSGFVYVVGGLAPLTPPRVANATTSVYVSRILPDGFLEPWASTSSLNVARSSTALVSGPPSAGVRYLLAVGGHANDNSGLDSIERAVIQPDGSLSPWEFVEPLPAPRNTAPVAQTDSLVVLPGGFRGGGDTRVLIASLGPSGLGPWREGAALPERTLGGSAVAVGNRVHITIGNSNGSSWTPAVYSASLEAEGIGSWRPAPPLQVARYLGALVSDGHGGVISVGGITPGGLSAQLEHAAADRSGDLLPWTLLGSLPVPTGGVAALGTRSAVYVFGGLVGVGAAGGPTAAVWRAPLG